MKRTVFTIFTLLLLNGCIQNKVFNYEENIIGYWCLNSEDLNYPSIIFNEDSSAIFNSHIDTVYTFKYFVEKNYLHIYRSNKNGTDKYEILYLDDDSLVFNTLIEKDKKQIYLRCRE